MDTTKPKVLIIGDTVPSLEAIKEVINKQLNNGTKLEIDLILQDEEVFPNDYDAYIYSDNLYSPEQCFKIVSKIRKDNIISPFFIIYHGNECTQTKKCQVLKNLQKLNVSGFIDPDDMDFSCFFDVLDNRLETSLALRSLMVKAKKLQNLTVICVASAALL